MAAASCWRPPAAVPLPAPGASPRSRDAGRGRQAGDHGRPPAGVAYVGSYDGPTAWASRSCCSWGDIAPVICQKVSTSSSSPCCRGAGSSRTRPPGSPPPDLAPFPAPHGFARLGTPQSSHAASRASFMVEIRGRRSRYGLHKTSKLICGVGRRGPGRVRSSRVPVMVSRMAQRLVTERLVLRPRIVGGAGAALDVYGVGEVARWLAPAMDRQRPRPSGDAPGAATVGRRGRTLEGAGGRWAIELGRGGRLVGGATLLPLY